MNSNRHNKELSRIFGQMADYYRYLGPAQRFRAQAYDTASKTLSNMQEPVDEIAPNMKQLEKLKGIGESIAEKIVEYLESGKIKTFEILKTEVPYTLFELLDVEGIGPATLRLLHDKLKINSKDELINALENEKLRKIKGLADKKIENLKQALKLKMGKSRLQLKDAEKIGQNFLNEIKKIPGVHKSVLAGSLRRKSKTVGDLDIVITAAEKNWKRIGNKIKTFSQIEKILAAGRTKLSLVLKSKHVQVDIRIVHDDEYGAALFYFTGNRDHNLKLRTIAKKKGWKINEYGVFNEKTNKRLAGETEEEIYNLFGLDYIPPEKRIGENELDKLKK